MRRLSLILLVLALGASAYSQPGAMRRRVLASTGGVTNPNFAQSQTRRFIRDNFASPAPDTGWVGNVGVGHLICLTIQNYPQGRTITVRDSSSGGANAYVNLKDSVYENASGSDVRHWWGIVATGKGGTVKFIVSPSGSGNYTTYFVTEFSSTLGFDANSFDKKHGQTQANPGTGANAVSSGATTSRAAQYEILVGGECDSYSNSQSYTAGTVPGAWTIPTNGSQPDGTTHTTGYIEYLFVSATGTDAAVGTISTTGISTGMTIVTFKAAGQ